MFTQGRLYLTLWISSNVVICEFLLQCVSHCVIFIRCFYLFFTRGSFYVMSFCARAHTHAHACVHGTILRVQQTPLWCHVIDIVDDLCLVTVSRSDKSSVPIKHCECCIFDGVTQYFGTPNLQIFNRITFEKFKCNAVAESWDIDVCACVYLFCWGIMYYAYFVPLLTVYKFIVLLSSVPKDILTAYISEHSNVM